MDISSLPDRLPAGQEKPLCWRADYSGQGDVTVWVCGYRVSGNAFEALQQMRSAANEVKLQKGAYLLVAHWSNTSQAGITALVTAIQKSLPNQ